MRNKFFLILALVLSFGLSNASAQTPPANAPKLISGGVLNGKATSLPKPAYPAAARAVGASGAVNVKVTIDEQGSVVSATAVSGHPLLRQASEQAALGARFSPTLLSGQPVSVTGVLVYNFVGPASWLSEGVALGLAETKGISGKINLPDEFRVEREQLNTIAQLPVNEQKNQLSPIVSVIKSRLNATDLWRFEFGLAKGKIYGGNPEMDDTFFSSLAKFRELAMNKAEGVQEYEINRAVELAKFADKGSLTAEDKQTILSHLK